MFEELKKEIERAHTVIIHRHTHPDGDAMGSQIGLAGIIRENYPEKKVYTVGDEAGRYAFMDGAVMDTVGDDAYDGALAVVLDCASEALVSDKRFALAARTARVDHHIYCETFTDLEIVDTSFESCCGMIAEFAKECGFSLSSGTATAIFTGMVTDSGRFRYDSTGARTFALASFLMEAGVDTAALYRNLYAEELESVKRRASFICKITRYKDSAVSYIYNTAEEVASSGMDVFSVSRGMVNVMSDIRGIDIWVNFTEAEGKVLCELRSSVYNINPVAVKYGGGGHKKASGASVADRETAMMMLEDLRRLTEEENA